MQAYVQAQKGQKHIATVLSFSMKLKLHNQMSSPCAYF